MQVLPLCFQGDADEVSGHASHSPPLSVVLFLWARGEIRGGWGENPDRPAKADQIRESPSALALAVPARCFTTKWKSWSARNQRVTLALVSLARAIHCRGAWSVKQREPSAEEVVPELQDCPLDGQRFPLYRGVALFRGVSFRLM